MPDVNRYYDTSDISTYGAGDASNVESILSKNLQGIFGIPYQFLEDVDPRIPGSDIGGKYAEKILSKMPLLFLTPCRQVFMPGLSSETRESALQRLVGSSDAGLANESGKYYTTEFAYNKYYKYVNTMCSQLCYFTGIGDSEVITPNGGSTKLKNIDWENIKNKAFDNYFSASDAVVFYLDGFASVSDSFSNSSTESSLANTINGFRDQANELKFLLGPDSALTQAYNMAGEVTDTITSGLSGMVGGLFGGMLGELANKGVNTIVKGGKIIFPKIWQDFTYDRSSFSFTIKLRSPDHDTLSIVLNVLIPYIHLLGMVLPIGLEDDPNGFISPFLVKAYSKGMFNIDMGLITNLTATRGEKCQWNDDGLPTQIDIDITIEDLYSSLFMTPLGDDKGDSSSGSILGPLIHVARNTAMMDFLANMAGLNIAEQEIARSWRMYSYLIGSSIARAPSTIWHTFDTKIANVLSKLYR